jgi:hypothetical protein
MTLYHFTAEKCQAKASSGGYAAPPSTTTSTTTMGDGGYGYGS